MALGSAYELLEEDDELRCGVLFAHGEHFTGGLDLAEVGPALAEGSLHYPEDARDPWRNDGKPWTTPVVAAAQGWCMTLGIELLRPAGRPGHPRLAQRAIAKGDEAAAARLTDDMVALLRTEDGAEGMMSFVERRPAKFTGR